MSVGTERRDTAMGQLSLALGAAGDTWSSRAYAYISNLTKGDLLDADSLRAAVGEPYRANAFGAIFYHASRDGLIEVAGYKPSEREERRAAVVRLWRRS